MSLFTNPQMSLATGMPVLSPNHKDIGLNYSISAFGIGAPTSYQITFQQPRSPIAEGIFTFHDDLILFLIGILGFVLIIILSIISIGKKGSNNTKIFSSIRVIHEAKLEIIWTCLPALFLVIIAIPSFSLLYSVDEIVEPWLIFKVIGHQWYWSYEFLTPKLFSKLYSDIKANDSIDFSIEDNSSFDSYRLSLDDMPKKLTYINKLIVDNHLYLPTKVQLRAIITSTDVLHCWAVPSLGIKLDACPGRLNQIGLFINNQGFYYGQCSEICGVNHGFIPVGIVGVNFYILNDQNKIDFDPLLSFFYDIEKEIKPVLTATGFSVITLLTAVGSTLWTVAPFVGLAVASYTFLKVRSKPTSTPFVQFDVGRDEHVDGGTNRDYTVVEPDSARGAEITQVVEQISTTMKEAGSSEEELNRVISYLSDHLSPAGANGQMVVWQSPLNIQEIVTRSNIQEGRFKTALEASLQKRADWYLLRIPGTNGKLTQLDVKEFSQAVQKQDLVSTIDKLTPFVKAISKKSSPQEHSEAVRDLINSTVIVNNKPISVNRDIVTQAVIHLWSQLG